MAVAISSLADFAFAQPVSIEPQGFTEFMAKELRLSVPSADVRVVGPLSLTVTVPASGGHDLHLDTVYSACTRNAANCARLMEDFVDGMATFYQTAAPPLNVKSLRLAVRMTDHVEALRQAMTGKGGPATEALPGGYWLVVVSDLPTTIQMINARDLAGLGLSPEQALAVARKNMRATARREIKRALKGGGHDAVLIAGDAYEAGLLAFPELWQPVAEAYGGELLVSVPATDVVLCGGKGAGPDLVNMAKTVMKDDEHPLSAAVFRWTPTGWELAARPKH